MLKHGDIVGNDNYNGLFTNSRVHITLLPRYLFVFMHWQLSNNMCMDFFFLRICIIKIDYLKQVHFIEHGLSSAKKHKNFVKNWIFLPKEQSKTNMLYLLLGTNKRKNVFNIIKKQKPHKFNIFTYQTIFCNSTK